MKKVASPTFSPFSLSKALEKNFPILFKKLSRQKGWRLLLLKWIIREKYIRQLLLSCGNNNGSSPDDIAKKTIAQLFAIHFKPIITVHPQQKEKIDVAKIFKKKSTPTLFLANHPLGGLDGLILLHTLLPHHPQIKILANPLLLELKPLHSVFLPVEVFRKNRFSMAKKIRQAFTSARPLIAFPARRVARKINGKIVDEYWHSRLIKESAASGYDIVLIHISAKNSHWFYSLAWLRTKLGISSNLEMLLLPRELLSRNKVKAKLTISKTIKNSELIKMEKAAQTNKHQNAWEKVTEDLRLRTHNLDCF